MGVPAPIEGSPLVQHVLTGSRESSDLSLDAIFGGKMIVEADPIAAGNLLIERILAKRKALGLTCPELPLEEAAQWSAD